MENWHRGWNTFDDADARFRHHGAEVGRRFLSLHNGIGLDGEKPGWRRFPCAKTGAFRSCCYCLDRIGLRSKLTVRIGRTASKLVVSPVGQRQSGSSASQFTPSPDSFQEQ